MQGDALLVERLLDGSFGAAGLETRKAALDEVARAYAEALSNVTVTPSEFAAVVAQIELLARFFAARDIARREAGLRRTAQQLRDLAAVLQPSVGSARGGGAPEDAEDDAVTEVGGPTVARATPRAAARKASRRSPPAAAAPATRSRARKAPKP